MIDFHASGYDRKLKRSYEKAKEFLSPKNCKLISDYDSELATLGLKKSTRAKQIFLIVEMSIKLGKDWDVVVKSDIDGLVRSILDKHGDELGGETETTRDFKKTLKPFFRWVKTGTRDFKEVGDPPELKSIRLKSVQEKIVREQLLTEDDHQKLLAACAGTDRDRAFLDVHYEAGTRPGEILSLLIKHVIFDDKGAVIHVDGKTGPRPIRLVTSVPNLAKWVDVHPFKDNPEAPLWIMLHSTKFGNPMTYSTATAMLDRKVRKAKIKKKINLKLFRHSAATRLSKHLPESTMRLRHGWAKNSTMPSRYVHLNNSDVDSAILKLHGIPVDEEENETHLPKMCIFCNISNAYEATICVKCGKPLDLETALRKEEEDMQEKQDLEDRLARQEQATQTILMKLEQLGA